MTQRRVDNNQKQVVTALRKCGFSVAITSMIGKGFPDLVIAKAGVTHLCELKNPAMFKSGQRLTKDEEIFHEGWKGKIITANNIDDIIKAFN